MGVGETHPKLFTINYSLLTLQKTPPPFISGEAFFLFKLPGDIREEKLLLESFNGCVL